MKSNWQLPWFTTNEIQEEDPTYHKPIEAKKTTAKHTRNLKKHQTATDKIIEKHNSLKQNK